MSLAGEQSSYPAIESLIAACALEKMIRDNVIVHDDGKPRTKFDRREGRWRFVERRVRRDLVGDVGSGQASGEARGTPMLVIDGVVLRGGFAASASLEVLAR